MVIYKITNLINNKIYIGQTTQDIEKRWQRHNWACTKNRNAMAITNALIKYGSANFSIEKIDDAKNIDELNKKEEFYIKEYNSLSPNGYNLSKGGDNKKMSEETKKKISEKNKGRKASEETIKKLSDSHKGWIPSEETREKWRKAFSGKKPSENTRIGSILHHQKTYTMKSPSGEIITFTNMKEFCKENGLCNSKLCLVSSGKRKKHKGWTLP
jgi:group I intron endonuclease